MEVSRARNFKDKVSNYEIQMLLPKSFNNADILRFQDQNNHNLLFGQLADDKEKWPGKFKYSSCHGEEGKNKERKLLTDFKWICFRSNFGSEYDWKLLKTSLHTIRISKLSSDWTSQHHLKENLENRNVAESTNWNVGLPFRTYYYIRKFIGHSTSKNHKVMNQIDEPASYGIGIENISIYFRASSKEKNGTVDFFVKPIFLKNNLKKKKNRNFHFRFRPELIFSVKLNWIYYLYCLNNIHEARRGER